MPAEAEKLLISVEEAAHLLSLDRATVYAMMSSSRLGVLPIKLNRRTLFNRKELEAWTDAGCPTRDRWQEIKSTSNCESKQAG